MDVYNLILDRGYLGALKYASEIEDKNFRLASEIDQIVSELYRIASGVSGFRYAQSSMPQFDTYTPRRPSFPVQTTAPAPTPTYSPAPRPAGMPDSGDSSILSNTALITKIRYAVQTGEIPAKIGGKIIDLLLKNSGLSQAVLDSIQTALRAKPVDYRSIITALNGASGLGAKSASRVIKILDGAASKFSFLKPVANLIGKSAKFLGPLALAFDTYDIYTDYEREGFSGRVICKIVSAILGLSALLTAAFPPASAILAGLWAASSIGCGLFSSSNKNEEAYKNLNQSEIDKAEFTVTLESLPQSDQNLVRDLFNNKTRAELINGLRRLRDSKKFEKPVESLAYIQRQLASGNGQIVPIG